MFLCYVGCEGFNYGISLVHPFIDPQHAVDMAKKDGNPKLIEGTRKYCLYIKGLFGKYYDIMGISIDEIIKSLEEIKMGCL